MELLLNEYENLKEIGKGSFAKIYKVRHHKLDYIRAIRVLNAMVVNEEDHTYQTFVNECKTLLQLGNGCHPNLAHIYQPRLLQNHALVEMDYIDGCDLEYYLKEQNHFVPVNEIMRFLLQISSALAYCHIDCYEYLYDKNKIYEYKLKSPLKGTTFQIAPDPTDGNKDLITDLQRQELIRIYGVTHNDLHSKNIMRKRYDGNYILLDFGLVIQNGKCVKSSSRRDGAIEYKAPEKWDSQSMITTRTDIYSFGILLYEMLAGQVPFPYLREKYSKEEQALYELSIQHEQTKPPAIEPLRRAAFEAAHPGKTYEKDYPCWLEDVIIKCLEKKPEKRYTNAKELYEEVKPLIETNNYNTINELKSITKENVSLTQEVAEKESKITSLLQAISKLMGDNERMQQEMNRKKSKRKSNPAGIILCLLLAALSSFFGFKYYKLSQSVPIDPSHYESTISKQQKEINSLRDYIEENITHKETIP